MEDLGGEGSIAVSYLAAEHLGSPALLPGARTVSLRLQGAEILSHFDAFQAAGLAADTLVNKTLAAPIRGPDLRVQVQATGGLPASFAVMCVKLVAPTYGE